MQVQKIGKVFSGTPVKKNKKAEDLRFSKPSFTQDAYNSSLFDDITGIKGYSAQSTKYYLEHLPKCENSKSSSALAQTQVTNATQSVQKSKISRNKKILIGSIVAGAVVIGGIAVCKLTHKPPKIENDSAYRKKLLKSVAQSLGIDETDTSVLKSIMDKDELADMLKEFKGDEKVFSQGKRLQAWVQDTNTTENIENLSYRANLHIHTVHSDGKMSVKQLLDNAAEYADKVRAKIGSDAKYPFTIAITDHDSVEGCKEAVKIIAKNPEKYENLKVLLGCEMTTFHSDIPSVKTAHRTHLLAYNINPFEGEFVDLLNAKHQRTFSEAQRLIDKMNEKMHSFWDFKEINYNLDEAKTVNFCIRDGLNVVNYPLKDYFQFRKIYHEAFTYNDELSKFLKSHNISKADIPFKDTGKNVTYIHKKVTRGEDMPYWNKYLISLKWEILKKIHGDDFVLTKDNYKTALSEIDKYFTSSTKNLGESMNLIEREYFPLIRAEENQVFDFTKTLEKFAQNDDISFCIAHPALIKQEHCDIEKRKKFIAELFEKFKNVGGKNARFYEKVYPYFNSNEYPKIDNEFLDFISKEAEKHSLIPSGSLDNHGKHLFWTE